MLMLSWRGLALGTVTNLLRISLNFKSAQAAFRVQGSLQQCQTSSWQQAMWPCPYLRQGASPEGQAAFAAALRNQALQARQKGHPSSSGTLNTFPFRARAARGAQSLAEHPVRSRIQSKAATCLEGLRLSHTSHSSIKFFLAPHSAGSRLNTCHPPHALPRSCHPNSED